jgi:hypothetical protein
MHEVMTTINLISISRTTEMDSPSEFQAQDTIFLDVVGPLYFASSVVINLTAEGFALGPVSPLTPALETVILPLVTTSLSDSTWK